MSSESNVLIPMLEAQLRTARAIADLYVTMQDIAQLVEGDRVASRRSGLMETETAVRAQIVELERKLAELS